jgi:Calcineurin-like phosphoesterase
MPEIRYLFNILLILTVDSYFSVPTFSQSVTGDSNLNSSINPVAKSKDSGNITVIDTVGDIDCSRRLHDQVIKDNPTIFIILGDLCYKRDLTNFINTHNDFRKANKLECVIGNHESLEDGNLKILNEALEYCGDHWYRKIANDTTVLIGLNTNGNISLQTNWGQSLVTNSTSMEGIKNVILLAHKPAHTPLGSNHKVENSTIQLFSAILSNIPSNIRAYEITAHNHFMAKSSNDQWFISGAGGKRLHEVSADPSWSFVNNKEHGYLQIRINNTDGDMLSTHFHALNGSMIQ